MRLLLITLFSGLSLLSFSQKTLDVSYTIKDADKKTPIEFAKVVFYNSSDSTAVSGAFSDEAGKVTVEKVKIGEYYVRVTAIGFVDSIIGDINIVNIKDTKTDLGVIFLKSSVGINFEEIEVTAESELLVASIDKRIYDVSQDLSSKGGSASDVLKNVPSVEVDQDGNVSLRGNGNVTILIDGRPSAMGGGSAQAILDAIPASSIERVEMVTNPSAKYDPDGTAGIINIVLKKSKLRGVNGNVGLTLATGNLYNGSIGLNARNEKVNFFANYSYNHREGSRNMFSNWVTTFEDSIIKLDQSRLGTDTRNTHAVSIGSDFNLKERNIIGFKLNGSINDRTRTGDQDNFTYLNDSLQGNRNRVTEDPNFNKSFTANADYEWKFKKDKGSLVNRANFSYGGRDGYGYFDEYYFDEDGMPTGEADLRQETNDFQTDYVLSLSSDFTRNFEGQKRIELGAKSIIKRVDRTFYSESRDSASQSLVSDTALNNQFLYDEQVYAVYGIWGQSIKKFKYQVGLRLEQALTQPQLITTGEDFENNYFSAFPSLHTVYQITKSLDISASYSRRINRPSSRSLNPFPNYSDPLNIRTGNPALKPEYIDSYELGLLSIKKKLTLSTSAYFKRTQDVIQRIKFFNADGTSIVSNQNIDESFNYGIELIASLKINKNWKNTISANAYQTQLKGSVQELDFNNQGFSYNIKYSGTYEFWNRTASVQLNARYVAPRITAQGEARRRTGIDISFQKLFFDKKLTLGARVSDVFNNVGFEYSVEQGNITQDSEFKWLTRRFYLSLSYRFGKVEMSKNKPNIGGSDGGGDF